MKYCEHCGGKLEGKSSYCSNCGAEIKGVEGKEVVNGAVVNNTNISNQNEQAKDNTTISAFVCSIIGALCCTYIAIPGLILSIQSLMNMNAGKISSEKKWMAITGIVLSAIGIIQLVYNLMYPAHNQELIKQITVQFNIKYE